MIKDRESERRVILRDAALPGGVGPTQTHLYMNGTKLMGQMYNEPSVPIIDFSAIPATVPPGAITPYIADIAPQGWGLCDGTAYDSYEYRLLHSLISNKFGGTAYQAGVTNMPNSGYTFNVPDFKGKMLMMADPTLSPASSVGDSGGQLAPSLPEHDHTIDQSNANIDSDNKIIDLDNGTTGPIALDTGEEVVELWGEEGPVSNPPGVEAAYSGLYGHQLYPVTTFGEVGLGGSLSVSTEGDAAPVAPTPDMRNVPPYVCINYLIRLV